MSPARVRVALVPPAPGSLPPEACAVAVDVLRASTTLAVASRHGASRIVPFGATDVALGFRDSAPGVLACGERDGRIVAGFDLGNSPFEYTRERVAGRTLAFASTNGSRAMLSAERCQRRVLAAFVNLTATLDVLAGEEDVVIVCAGKEGRQATEDTACAGTLARRLLERGASLANLEAHHAVQMACATAAEVRVLVEASEHGRWLASLGDSFAADVRFCATLDELDSVAGW